MADILVLGANGFIGSHLVDALRDAGHLVTAFDRYSTQPPTFSTERVRVLTGDFLSRADLDEAVRGQDYVLHFLSTTTPATAENDPTLDIRTNLAQTIELLESCVHAGVRQFYFASTGGAIYGPQDRDEFSETEPTLPISPYGIGKMTVESYLRYYRVKHGLVSTSLRISNPYGPRQRAGRRQGLIPIALRQAIRGEPVVRFGDGSMVRDYLFVDDLVRMVLKMVGAGAQHDVYNIGSGVGHSVREVLDAIRGVTGLDLREVEAPTPATFVDRVVLDTSRFRDEFGGELLSTLEEGIAVTWAEAESHDD